MTRSRVTYVLSVRSTLLAARLGLTSRGDAPGTAVAAAATPWRPCVVNSDELHDAAPCSKTDEVSRTRDPSDATEDAWREPSPEDDEIDLFASL